MSDTVMEGFRLSPPQQRLWRLQLKGAHGASPKTRTPFWSHALLGLSARPERAPLEAALRSLVARHELLRTGFASLPGMTLPLQVIRERGEQPSVRWHDLGGRGTGHARRALGLLIEEARREEVNWERGAALRVNVLGPVGGVGRWWMLLSLPAMYADGRGMSNLGRELARCYGGEVGGADDDSETEVVQYVDLSEWQNELFESEDTEGGRAYWAAQSSGDSLEQWRRWAGQYLSRESGEAGEGLKEGGFRPAQLRVALRGAERRRVEAAAEAAGVGVSEWALACWALLWSRLGGQTELAVGTRFDGRRYEGMSQAPGLLAKYLPLQVSVPAEATPAELARAVASGSAELRKWQEYYAPEEGRDEAHAGVCYSFAEQGRGGVYGNLGWTSLWEYECAEAFKVKLVCEAGGARRLGNLWLHYDAARFGAREVSDLGEHLRTLLSASARTPERAASRLALYSERQRRRLLEEVSRGPRVELDARVTVQELFEQQAARTPGATAVVYGEDEVTYAELNARANRLAARLRELGVGPESRVGLLLERSVEMVVAILGTLKAGGAYVPLDAAYPDERLRYVVGDAALRVVIASPEQERRAASVGVERVLRVQTEEDEAQSGETAGVENVRGEVGGENLAYVIYTSGSTGRPKGVMVTHGGLLNYLRWSTEFYRASEGEGSVVHSSVGFDLTVTSLFPALLKGRRVLLAPEEGAVEALAETLRRGGDYTLLKLTPTHLDALRHLLADEDLAGRARSLVIGGEALRARQAAHWRERAPGTRLINEYGPTETVVGCCVYEVSESDGTEGDVPIGRPVANTRLYVLDRRGELAPPGATGELYIGGAGVARGYLNRPALTAERFVPDPFSDEPGARLYRTGDLARYRPDGELEFLGRIDHQVKVRGYRIELGEIEASLLGVGGVSEAAVEAREDARGEKRLVAYVVWDEAAEKSVAELRSRLRERLPDYMVPSAFVELERLPLTQNGKVDRRALPEPEEASGRRTVGGYEAARTPAEETLCGIWSEVLGVERVGVRDNFFELGGDSILSIQIVARAARLGLGLTPKSLFEHQTVAELAAAATLRADSHSAAGAGTTREPEAGDAPLTPIQHRFFALHRSSPHHFNQSVLLSVREPLTRHLLETVAGALLRQHDALRLRFERDEGNKWRQRYADFDEGEAGRVASLHDLSGLGEAEALAALDAEGGRLQASLDLCDGPLMRVGYFQLGGVLGARLLIVIHHLAVDGVSWRILLEDLERAYGQAKAGVEVSLGDKTSPYGEWARGLEEYAAGGRLQGEVDYWLAQAEALSRVSGEVTALGRERKQAEAAGESAAAASLSEELTKGLLQEAGRAYGTRVTEVLLAGLLVAWEEWCGETALAVDAESHGREAELIGGADVTRTVGWFTAVYPLVLELPRGREAAGKDYGRVLKAVKERVRGVPGGGVGYGVLRYLGRDEGVRQRLEACGSARVSFNYLGQFDTALKAGGGFEAAAESAGRAHAAETEREYELGLAASVTGGRLNISIDYDSGLYEKAEVERLAAGYVRALTELVEHCRAEEVGGYTPSDFPLAKLGQQALDRLVGVGRHVEAVYPLSPIQEGLLFQTLYDPAAGVYFEQLSCLIRGRFDAGAFERAWRTLIERHTILRTAFAWDDLERPLQVVRRHASLPLVYEDWRGLDAEEQASRLETFLAEDRRRGFDLSEAPLMRFALLRTGEDEHRFVWSHHHLLLDGWSMQLLIGEAFGLYRELRRGGQAAETKAPPFENYIAWLQRRDASAAETFWRETLKGFDTPTVVPGRAVEGVQKEGPVFEETRAQLSESATARLQQLARGHHLTLNTLVQGAWGLLLSRYSGEPDVVFGATVSGRPAEVEGVESMVGLFINTLPVRVRVEEGAPLVEWLRRLQSEQAEARQHEYSSLVEVQGWSEVQRGTPLFESLLAFENYPVDAALRESVRESGVEVEEVRFVEATHYPLTVIVAPGAQLLVRMIYDRGRYDEATAARMLEHLAALLEGMAADPSQKVSRLELLTEAERRTLLEEWNGARAERLEGRCLAEVFEEQAARTPEAVALVYGERQLTYAELNARANRLARRLRRLGVGPETLVGILAERGVEMLVGVLGVLKAGGAYVPLDPAYPRERLKLMLEDSGALALLTAGSVEPPEQGARVVRLDADWEDISAEGAGNLPPSATPDNLCYVIYTSGSTGRPKGVAMRHEPLTNLIAWQLRNATLPAEARTLQFTSLSFDVSFQEMFATWCSGGALVMISEETRRDAERLLEVITGEGVGRLFLPFVALQQLAEAAAGKDLSGARLSEVITAGEQLQVTPRVVEMLGRLPGCTLHNQYGPAETHVVTALALEGEPRLWPHLPPIGRPVAGAKIYLLDARLRLVPVGVAGELYVGGDALARGYLNRPALTAERFVPDPFSSEPGARLYRTGDSARFLPDGRIEFLGRLDQQVKIRGYRVEPGEIETVLAAHEAVREAVVVAAAGEGGAKRLVAYLVAHEDARPSHVELRRFVAERLPAYMVPSAYVFMERLPLTPSGKVNRRALSSPPALEREAEEVSGVARGVLEELVCGIVAQTLQIEHAGPDDNFFELGGHSLLAAQVVTRVREAFGAELPLRALFESNTVGELAARVEELRRAGRGASVPPIRPAARAGAPPASFAQQRLWFLDQLEPDSPLYNIPAAVRLRGRLDVTALERALGEIVRRHEALRTTFEAVKGQPVQVIAPEAEVKLTRVDLSGLEEAEREAAVRELSAGEARRPFDLARDMLLRAALLRLADEEHVLLFTMHHIVSDGWSMGVLIKEFTTLYEAFSEGRPSPLAPLAVQYADFAVWQREWLRGEVLERQLDYWKRQLGGAQGAVLLPADSARPEASGVEGAIQPFALPPDASRALKEFSRRRNATLFMTLLAAFKALLHCYGGQRDLLVGTPVANRNSAETEPLIGFFVNTLVMRTDLSGDPTFEELLGRVREVVIQAHTHQDVPFERLVAELQSERDLNRSPLFNVWFVLQNSPVTRLTLPGLTVSPLPVHSGTARHELKLDLWETPEGLAGSFEYKTHLFTPETAARISQNFETLLRHLPDHPEARLENLRELIAETDKQQRAARGREFNEARRQKLQNLRRQPRKTYSDSLT